MRHILLCRYQHPLSRLSGKMLARHDEPQDGFRGPRTWASVQHLWSCTVGSLSDNLNMVIPCHSGSDCQGRRSVSVTPHQLQGVRGHKKRSTHFPDSALVTLCKRCQPYERYSGAWEAIWRRQDLPSPGSRQRVNQGDVNIRTARMMPLLAGSPASPEAPALSPGPEPPGPALRAALSELLPPVPIVCERAGRRS